MTSGFQAHARPAAQMFIRVHVRVPRRQVESVLFRLSFVDSVELQWGRPMPVRSKKPLNTAVWQYFVDVDETLGRGPVVDIANLFILGPFVLDACYGGLLICVSVISKGIAILARCWKLKRINQKGEEKNIYSSATSAVLSLCDYV